MAAPTANITAENAPDACGPKLSTMKPMGSRAAWFDQEPTV